MEEPNSDQPVPNRAFHLATSSFVGTITAYRMADDQPTDHRLLEVVGGFLGGVSGGRLPDVIEPPLNPHHRGFAHSVVTSGAVLKTGEHYLSTAQKWLRDRADHLVLRAEVLPANSAGRAVLLLLATLCRIASGFLAGLASGYVTHVAFDALTPRSVSFA